MEKEEKKEKENSAPAPRTTSRKADIKKGKRKREGNGAAFSSVHTASRRLYHSVLQTPLCLKGFDDGADSDADEEAEQVWRLRLTDDDVEDYLDTIAVEKLFMNLWNQFTRMDYAVRADRHVAPACMAFVKSKLFSH